MEQESKPTTRSSSPVHRVAAVSELYNSVPAKIQPWMQAAGGIPPRAKGCGVATENTHGIPLGSTLIMANNPAGLAPKETHKDGDENGEVTEHTQLFWANSTLMVI